MKDERLSLEETFNSYFQVGSKPEQIVYNKYPTMEYQGKSYVMRSHHQIYTEDIGNNKVFIQPTALSGNKRIYQYVILN